MAQTVNFLQPVTYAGTSYVRDQVVTVDDDTARVLISSGYAQMGDGPAVGAPPGGRPPFTDAAVATLLADEESDANAAVEVEIAEALTHTINVQDYGATGDGVTDDTAAIQAAVDAALGGTPAAGATTHRTARGILFFPRPAVAYRVTAPIKVYSARGLTIQGIGEETIIYADGAGLSCVFDLNGLFRCRIQGLTIMANPDTVATTTVDTVVRLDWSAATSIRSTQGVVLSHITVRNVKCVNGIGIGVYSGSSDVSAITVENCQVTGSWVAGETVWYQSAFHFGNGTSANVLNHWARSLRASAFRYSVFADAVNLGVDGLDTGYAEVDLYGRGTGEVSLSSCRSEHSARLYTEVGGSSYSKNVSLSNIEFIGNSQFASDGYFIYKRYSGSLVLVNVKFRPAETAVAPVVYVQNGNTREITVTALGLTMPVPFTAAVGGPVAASSPFRYTLINYHQNNLSSQTVAVQPFYSGKVNITGGPVSVFADGIGVGNAAAATTPGSVVKKIEVFDANGASIGFVPVYGTIT